MVDLGLATTDLVYFASGRLAMPGAMFTASHNPAEYNGIKLCRAGARPVSLESGLAAIRDRVAALPEVASVDVSRQWPDRILVRVTERRAVIRELIASRPVEEIPATSVFGGKSRARDSGLSALVT